MAAFFEQHPVEEIRSGKADTADDPQIARAAKQVGFKAPLALGMSEKLIDEGGKVSLADGLKLELDHLTEIFKTEDAYEGLSTLGRKRPVFKGR